MVDLQGHVANLLLVWDVLSHISAFAGRLLNNPWRAHQTRRWACSVCQGVYYQFDFPIFVLVF